MPQQLAGLLKVAGVDSLAGVKLQYRSLEP